MSAQMHRIGIKDVAAVIATGRFEEAKAWYTRLLDREPDLEPVPGVAEWQLTATAWLQVVTDDGGAGRSAVRFGVDNLGTTVAWLRDNGVSVPEPQVIADMVAVIDVADPDGNEVSFVAELA
ncbi:MULTISPECIES: VOC family protein [Mycolicibacterium]|nr:MULTISPECIES: VOC family protein [Mycolicibacterium]MCV7334831.1 glyoxalase/bleomycin resistance/dioxygenase family protein [Mycolicibacterium senegalense]MDR7290217.1 catechol 2,3-dioxygenase-like lactoylglutathione lyase family enzyme [Mycolicibacterium senegalense]QZA26955.1 glyoxalase/bleomycin resistance/dioxygenase family protein [Mycolicibacterium senegalense]